MTYKVTASGVFDVGESIAADAKFTKPLGEEEWTDGTTRYESHGTGIFEILITYEKLFCDVFDLHSLWKKRVKKRE